MPMYDYQCPDGHITEHWHKSFEQGSVCGLNGCMQKAQYIPSFYYTSQAAQRFTPVVVHKDSEGNIRFPGHPNAPLPPGFHKVELTNLHEVRKFEAEINKKDSETAEKFRSVRSQYLDGQLKENRRVMAELMDKLQFTPQGRRFYERMKKASMERQEAGRRRINPGFYVEAFTQDASNREGYRDASNNWGKHQGNNK